MSFKTYRKLEKIPRQTFCWYCSSGSLQGFFDCIPHQLRAAKLHAYGLSEDAVTFVHSYLKRRKQGVKINGTESVFQIHLSGIPQGFMLGPILFNLFFFIKGV